MKKIKLIFLTLTFTFMSMYSIFAQNNSGAIVSINAGDTFPMSYDKDKYDFANNTYSTFQAGYLFNFAEKMGASIIGEIGYNLSITGNTSEILDKEIKIGTYVHSLVFGIMPTFNIHNFSIGLGTGVKVPVNGVTYLEYTDIDSSSYNISGRKIEDNINVTPYLKLVVDYSLFVDTRTSIVFGINTGYDFGVGDEPYKASPEAYYLGFQIGIKFGPKL